MEQMEQAKYQKQLLKEMRWMVKQLWRTDWHEFIHKPRIY